MWPKWWDWELELSPHLEKRMEDREFSQLPPAEAGSLRGDPVNSG